MAVQVGESVWVPWRCWLSYNPSELKCFDSLRNHLEHRVHGQYRTYWVLWFYIDISLTSVMREAPKSVPISSWAGAVVCHTKLLLETPFRLFQDPTHWCPVSPAEPGIEWYRRLCRLAIIEGPLAFDLIPVSAKCEILCLVWEGHHIVFRAKARLVIAAASSPLPIISPTLVDLIRHPQCLW